MKARPLQSYSEKKLEQEEPMLVKIRAHVYTTYNTNNLRGRKTVRQYCFCTQSITRCPICGEKIKSFANPIIIAKSRYIKACGKCCHHCHVFFAAESEFLKNAIQVSPERNLFHFIGRFIPSSKQIQATKYDDISITLDGQETTAYSVLHGNVKAVLHDCYICSLDLDRCPMCYGDLTDGYVNPILISESRFIKVIGKQCMNCRTFFTAESKLLTAAVQSSPQKDLFHIGNLTNIGDSTEFQTAFAKIAIRAKHNTKERARNYTIVKNKKEAISDENVLYYLDDTARKLLTAVLSSEPTVEINGTEFIVERIRFVNEEKITNPILRPSTLVEIRKGTNGGYYTPDPRYELVNGLVFCEKTRKLEVLRVTYDKEDNIYFVDQTVYDRFRVQCGYPIVRYASAKSGYGYVELRDRSLLHLLGYNVGARDHLSDARRHEILGLCVDFMFMRVRQIVNLLVSLIERNGIQHPHCIPLWENDLEFIQSYKVNPERFVFAQRIRGLK